MSFFIAVVSLLAAYLLHRGFDWANMHPPWWIETPSVMGFYAILQGIFDGWLWRTKLARRLHLVRLPNLNGDWEGYLISSFDPAGERLIVRLKVVQTWRRIRVTLLAKESESHSLGASVVADDPQTVTLSYEYVNEPKPRARGTMHTHRGTARLAFQRVGGIDVLDGEYYTGRDRQNFGVLRFERANPNPRAR